MTNFQSIDKKILNYSMPLLMAWLRFNAGCSNPEYFDAQKGDIGLELQQVPQEYAQLLFWFKQQNFESYLELGVGRGGSFLLNVMFQSNLKLAIAVDNSEYWKDEQKESIIEKVKWLSFERGGANPPFTTIDFISTTTDNYFKESLQSDAFFDCIFIDADHSYEGVKKDYDNALKHIKDGGYIIFHDIASAQCPGVQRIWKEATEKHTAMHVFVQGNNCGIGIVKIRTQGVELKDKGHTGTYDTSLNAVTTEKIYPIKPWTPVQIDKDVSPLTEIESMTLTKSKYGVLLIETRPEINLEEVAAKHKRFLPEGWGLTIIGSKENEQVCCGALNRIHVNVKDFSIGILNKWLTSAYFWSLIPHEKVLVIQHDSQLLRPGIEEFLEYDWVGAPWGFCDFGGNGGLSLRTVSIMGRICETNVYGGDGVHGNEDIFFSNIMHKNGIGKLAPREVCEKFSCESIFKLGTIGEHAASKYLSPEQYQQIITQYK